MYVHVEVSAHPPEDQVKETNITMKSQHIPKILGTTVVKFLL